MRAIVISASHNPFEDNGIKIFSGRGEKLGEAFEARIEAWVAGGEPVVEGGPAAIGDDPDLGRHYVAHLRQILASPAASPAAASSSTAPTARPRRLRPSCSDRWASRSRRLAITRTAATSTSTAARRISKGCAKRSHASGARLGIAFDGDGDRALFVDRHGNGRRRRRGPSDRGRGSAAPRTAARRRGRGDGDEQHRSRARAARSQASSWCARRSATST